MKKHLLMAATGLFLLAAAGTRADTRVTVDVNNNDEATPAFTFKTVPHPATNDAATQAKFIIVDGDADSNSGDVDKLHDGRLPSDADQPEENFFFQAGTDGGRLQVDLGHTINIKQVNTYSWHPGTRGPQIYKLYAADGTVKDFNATPKKGTAPDQCGWKLVATVNTQPKSAEAGGQYGVNIADTNGNLGSYRYLLFDVAATEHDDDFGNTFYSEIDVVDANAPATPVQTTNAPAPATTFTVTTTDGKSTISIDTQQAPALTDWAQHKLAPALAEWYPKIAASLPSEGYTAPAHFSITVKPMDGVAYTTGKRVAVSSDWLEKEITNEAVGSLVHEAVHVVQQFGKNGDNNPGWLVEGTADYLRWFKYEPQSHGADIVWMRKLHHFTPRYDASYRTTANFLNWVTEKYDKDIVGQMNAAMREGNYDDALWKQYTGKTAPELGEEWKKDIEAQLAVSPAKTDATK
jgi:hypothetical protein